MCQNLNVKSHQFGSQLKSAAAVALPAVTAQKTPPFLIISETATLYEFDIIMYCILERQEEKRIFFFSIFFCFSCRDVTQRSKVPRSRFVYTTTHAEHSFKGKKKNKNNNNSVCFFVLFFFFDKYLYM